MLINSSANVILSFKLELEGKRKKPKYFDPLKTVTY